MQAAKITLLNSIQHDLVARYRDLANPWYGWVLPAYQAAPYRAVVDDLVALGATVDEDTDLNDDVSCRYIVRRDGDCLTAEFSLIGPYVAVLEVGKNGSGPIATRISASVLVREVLRVLNAHGLNLLDVDLLRTQVAMPFQNVEAGQGTLYQALISDTPSPLLYNTRMEVHSRQPLTVQVAPSALQLDPNHLYDERLIGLYRYLHEGSIKAAITRLPISTISSGFYDRQGDGTVHVSNLKHEHVPTMKKMIRGGSRPMLDVYWSSLAPGGGKYVCADDEIAFAAYSDLNFTLVPCKILKPKRVSALEASIWLEQRGSHLGLSKAVAPALDKYVSFIGDELPPFSELIQLLVHKCEDTRAAIVLFHLDDGLGFHYHQMLHAILRRHERILDSISQLVVLGRTEHAGALTRVAYEAFLNFYIDWLSPEFFGPRLQFLSAVRVAQGEGNQTLNHHLEILTNFIEFLEKTSEKARISPLGSFFHNSIYPPLSLVAHQSYAHLEQEASDFHDADDSNLSSRVEQLGRWLDVLTAALIVRVRNEIDFDNYLESLSNP